MSNLQLTGERPDHYRIHEMECIDEFERMHGAMAAYHFCLGNVHKYRYRGYSKDGEERKADMAKATTYIKLAEHYRHRMEDEL